MNALQKSTRKASNDMTPIEWCIYRAERDNCKDAASPAAELLAAHERLETIATDVNDWLKRSGFDGTAHQTALAAALAELKAPRLP